MPWVKLDDGFLTNRKAVAAGMAGRALFIAGLCYCARNLTDGWIAKSEVPLIAALAGVPAKLAAVLVDVGFWLDRGEEYEVHDYLEYNPSRADVEGERDAARERTNAARSQSVRANEPGTKGGGSRSPSRPIPKENLDDFEEAWSVYPRKKAKQGALSAYLARRRDGVLAETLMLGVKHYADECQNRATEERFIMHGATFFGPQKRYEDYLEPTSSSNRQPGWNR